MEGQLLDPLPTTFRLNGHLRNALGPLASHADLWEPHKENF